MLEGPPAGSLRYFAVLFAPPERRGLLEALYAFEATVREAVHSPAHEAAHARLQWWRGELDRWLAGKPQHPITVALAPLIPYAMQDATLLHEVLTAADLDLAHMTYVTQRELDAYLFRAAGALQTLAARALAGREISPAERDFTRRLGSAVRQVEMIRELESDVRDGRLYVPLDDLETAGVNPAEISARLDSAELLSLVNGWMVRIDHELQALPGILTPDERRSQRSGLVLGALHAKLLASLRHRRPVERQAAQLPPLQRLWTAWRAAVRYS